MRPTSHAGLLATLALLATPGCSCGDNRSGAPDGGVIDAATDAAPDAPAVVCDMPALGTIGGTCVDSNSCAAPNPGGDAGVDGGVETTPFCLNNLLPIPWPAEGFCTAFPCAGDDDCGDGNVCAMLPDGMGGAFGACLPACCEGVEPGQACSPERICASSLFGDDMGIAACVPGTPDVADGAPCVDFADCDRNSTCRRDKFQFPGGQCAVLQCNSDDDCAPGGDGRCVELTEDQVGKLCVDDCQQDTDCRTDQGYRCVDHGAPLGKFCRHPAPGDQCSDASDCGTGDPEDPWTCRTDNATNSYPGGYCTVEACDPTKSGATCPIRSFCVALQGETDTFCADECPTVGGSECGTGYECVEINSTVTPHNVCVPTGATVTQP